MTYEAWRCTYQSSEQAARAAYERAQELEKQLAAVQQGVLPVAWLAEYVDREGNSKWYVSTHKDLATENDMHGAPKPLYTHPTKQGLDVVAAAKALCKHAAKVQNVNFDDYWLIHGEEFKQEVQIVLDAAQAKQGE